MISSTSSRWSTAIKKIRGSKKGIKNITKTADSRFFKEAKMKTKMVATRKKHQHKLE